MSNHRRNTSDSRGLGGYGSLDVESGVSPAQSGYSRTHSSVSRERQPLLRSGGSQGKATADAGNETPLMGSGQLSPVPTFRHSSAAPLYGDEYSVPVGGGLDASVGRKQPAIRKADSAESKGGFIQYIIYAIINIIISVPGLYGYASVIFNHPVFTPYMNALPKLVIFSSCIHQLSFTLFSSLPFAIGTVQDAGLIFLSAMSNIIADEILDGGGTAEEVVSTTLVILPMGTASLGLVLFAMGKFRLADAVSYLPMPVVGGYLAFIGYFCLEAGTALCISESMMELRDWAYLLEPQNLALAVPGLVTGAILTWISRNAKSDAALPLAMVFIPALFYIVIFATGAGIEGAREGEWVGPEMPPVPVTDLFQLIDFSLVRWDLAVKCVATWLGMVFVVSFASCLDVAAISMDMGEALDTNRELATVGIGNFLSGCTVGFTGSYIFSQTIFTYRTGCHSKWIGVFIMIMFIAVVVSTVNFLSVLPLFFLGATLIFIGYDLLYEWLVEVRHKLLLTEYLVLIATFIAIHIIGIDFGILFGVVVAVIDHVVRTAQVSSVQRIIKRSRAVWTPEDWRLLQHHGYGRNPKIVTFEIKGNVFFGSQISLLQQISDDIGINVSEEEIAQEMAIASPAPRGQPRIAKKGRQLSFPRSKRGPLIRPRPQFVVLDLSHMNNLDASAARGCFLQLARMCAKRGVVVCASGANPRVEWMIRSHDVAYDTNEEDEVKESLLDEDSTGTKETEKLILFLTLYEALEFCENMLIQKITHKTVAKRPSFVRLDELIPPSAEGYVPKQPLSQIFAHILGLDEDEKQTLSCLDGQSFHDEVTFNERDVVFRKDTTADAFYVVLKGAVALIREDAIKVTSPSKIVSGAGKVKSTALASRAEELGEVRAILQVGTIFGFVDFLLERPRGFGVTATQDDTILAKLTHDRLDRLKTENPEVDKIFQSVLLQSSVMELANCTCSE